MAGPQERMLRLEEWPLWRGEDIPHTLTRPCRPEQALRSAQNQNHDMGRLGTCV